MGKLDSTKKRILLAAGPIFARKGFKAATIREISDAAEVNLASVNYYFGDKQQLYLETVIQARQMRVEQVPDPQWDAKATAQDRLHGYVKMILNRMVALQSAPWQVHLLMREILQPTEACRKLVHEYFRPFLQVLMQLIDEIVQCQLSDEKRMQMAFSIIGQCMFYRFAGDFAAMTIESEALSSEGFDIEHLADHITEFSLSALQGVSTKYDDIKLTDTKPTEITEKG